MEYLEILGIFTSTRRPLVLLLFLLILFSSSQVTAGDQILRWVSSLLTRGDQSRWWRAGEDLQTEGGDTGGPGLGLRVETRFLDLKYFHSLG